MKVTLPLACAALTIPFVLIFSKPAIAYDPCQRAIAERTEVRDALNRYYVNNCPSWSYEIRHCRNKARGHQLEYDLHMAGMRVRQYCN